MRAPPDELADRLGPPEPEPAPPPREAGEALSLHSQWAPHPLAWTDDDDPYPEFRPRGILIMASSDTSSFLLGGESIPACAFPVTGTVQGGTVVEPAPFMQQQRDFQSGQPKFWDNGDPQMQLVVTVQTTDRDPSNPDDDGRRRIYVKGQMRNAVGEALRGVKASDVQVGGQLFVRFEREDAPKARGMNGAKVYSAHYVPAPSPAAGFLAKAPEPAAQQYPPQPAPAPAAYAPQAQAQPQAAPAASPWQQTQAQPVWPGVDQGAGPAWAADAAPAPTPAAPPVQPAPAPVAAPVAAQPGVPVPPAGMSPEQLAALQAAGWTGLPAQG